MGQIFNYGFLIDRCVERLYGDFPRGRARRLEDFGLAANSDDGVIVRVAVRESLIIVTANRADFVTEISRYTRTSTASECRRSNGLILVPGHLESLDYRLVTSRLRHRGKNADWREVSDDNLRVSVASDMSVNVSPMPVNCQYCKRDTVSVHA